MSNNSEYNAWVNMRQRCNNPSTPWYHKYGGRGIKICDRWKEFAVFLEDMGRKPSPKHSLDRVNNDGDYEPSNCRWATQHEQVINMGLRNDNKLGIKGVVFDEGRGKFRVTVWLSGKQKFIGRFDTLEEAIKARREAVDLYYTDSV